MECLLSNIYSMSQVYKIYLISAEDDTKTIYKIGYTRRKVEERINSFKTGNVSNFEIIATYNCDKYHSILEKRLHRHYKSKRIQGEWFQLEKSDINSFIDTCNNFWNDINVLQTQNTYLLDKKLKY